MCVSGTGRNGYFSLWSVAEFHMHKSVLHFLIKLDALSLIFVQKLNIKYYLLIGNIINIIYLVCTYLRIITLSYVFVCV